MLTITFMVNAPACPCRGARGRIAKLAHQEQCLHGTGAISHTIVAVGFAKFHVDDLFEQECRALGEACAAARMRLDERTPDAFKQAFRGYQGAKAPTADYFERKCLSLRLSAVKRGMVVDATVTPAFLARVVPARCPVTLEPFDIDGKSPGNPSIDRLVNEVTYLAGNVCALSLRANRSKGERTFEEVAHIAQAGLDQHGLESVEWMRLASLMYGAWGQGFQARRPVSLAFSSRTQCWPVHEYIPSRAVAAHATLRAGCRTPGRGCA